MIAIWWQIFDILGTIAFAVSGVLVAAVRRMDIFGVFVLSAVTAVGGGIVRDLLIGRIPPTAFRSSLYFWLIIGTMFMTTMFLRYASIPVRHKMTYYWRYVYVFCDAIGLGSFTVTGTLLGYSLYPDLWVLNITLGAITAVGGGVIRDVLAGLIPGVLKTGEVYAFASVIGAISFYVLLMYLGVNLVIASIGSFAVTLAVRLLALRFHWNVTKVMRYRAD